MAHPHATTELSTYFALYLFLEKCNRGVYGGRFYTTRFGTGGASTVAIQEKKLQFEVAKGSIFADLLHTGNRKMGVGQLLEELEARDGDVRAYLNQVEADRLSNQEEEKKRARESLAPGDLDKAFRVLEGLRAETCDSPVQLRISGRIRNHTVVAYNLSSATQDGTITDIMELNNNSALIYLSKTYLYYKGEEDGAGTLVSVSTHLTLERLIKELELNFGTWFDLKLNALAQLVNE